MNNFEKLQELLNKEIVLAKSIAPHEISFQLTGILENGNSQRFKVSTNSGDIWFLPENIYEIDGNWIILS